VPSSQARRRQGRTKPQLLEARLVTLPLFPSGPLTDAPAPELRPYQERAVRLAAMHIEQGKKRILLTLPVAAGKMVITASVIRRSTVPVLFVAHRLELIDQCAEQLAKQGITNIGVLRGADERENPSASIQIASIQTLARRNKPPAGLIFIDESHRSLADTFVEHVFNAYPDAIIIGLTASPCRSDGRPLGEVWQVLETVASYSELLKRPEWMATPDCYSSPVRADLSGVGTKHGDYDEPALAEVMSQERLVGDLLRHWLELAHRYPVLVRGQRVLGETTAGERRRTFIFAVDIRHSKAICDRFAAAGVRIAHLDGTTPEDERRAMLLALRKGELECISNCMVLCLDEQTEILTSTGWTGIDAMTSEHLVANWEDQRVTFEKPIEVIRRERGPSERMVSAHGKRIDARVTEGHWMLYLTSQNPDAMFQRCQARELVGRQVRLPLSGIAEPSVKKIEEEPTLPHSSRSRRITTLSYKLRTKFGMNEDFSRVESARRVDRIIKRKPLLQRKPPNELTVNECSFIGFWIGDGWRANLGSGGVEYKLSQSEAYPKIIEWVDSLLKRLDFDFRRRAVPPPTTGAATNNNSIHWSFARGTGNGTQERRGLFPIEKYLDKCGSDLLWGLNESQFDALINGLWLADGDHGDGTPKTYKRAMSIHNTNKKLMDTLQAIAVVRGYGCTLSLGSNNKSNPKFKQDYILRLRKRRLFFMGHNRFDFENDWKPERVWCVRTRTKNIITRRNGKVLVMGNCEGVDAPEVKCVVHARPTQSLVLWLQSVGRILRPWRAPRSQLDGSNDPTPMWVPPLILDHAGNWDRHGPPHEDRIWSLSNVVGRKSSSKPYKLCRACFAYVQLSLHVCPYCKYLFTAQEMREPPRETADKLVYRSDAPENVRREFFDRMATIARVRGFKPGFASAKHKEHYGEWPPSAWSDVLKSEFATDTQWQARLESRLRTKAEEEGAWDATTEDHALSVGVDPAGMAPGSIADEVPKTETCVRCRGYGQVPSGLDGDERIQCPDCSGTGSIADEFSVYEDGSETFSAWVKREVG